MENRLNLLIFNHDKVTLLKRVSVRPLVGRSVGRSVGPIYAVYFRMFFFSCFTFFCLQRDGDGLHDRKGFQSEGLEGFH